jgi:hypothetical protein
MKPELMIEELHAISEQLGVAIRYDRGDFEGGYCILKDKKLVLVNRRLNPARKAAVLASAMSEIGLENVFLKPAVREFIEDEVAKADRSPR